MARGFSLTAEINLRGPTNIRPVVDNLRRQLGSINANVNVNINRTTVAAVGQLNTNLTRLNATLQATTQSATSATQAFTNLATAMRSVGNINLPPSVQAPMVRLTGTANNAAQAIARTRTEFEDFGRQAGLAVRRFAAFSAVTSVIYGLSNAFSAGVKQFIEFDKQITRLSQVTNESKASLANVTAEITQLSTSLGVASEDLAQASVTLAQAGFSANDTRKALEALAKSALAPSFDDLNQTVEGSIALMRQFGISAGQLEGALGSVNAVAAGFAVEASDLIAAIQRTGGVFASASRGVSEGTDALNEFLAIFTSIRATTRESAETIATGLRTIFTRIQRADTIEALKEYGVQLTDLEGKFVGPYVAVQRLAEGLGRIDPRDLKFSQIVEELGGFRQIGKVLPLIQQFSTAQSALKVAQQGQGSLALDAAKGQQALAVQIQKVREEFTALVRGIGDTQGFQQLVKLGLDLASALIKVADATKGILPLLGIMAAFRGVSAITQFVGGFGAGVRGGGANRRAAMGGPIGFASGGLVPGSGNRDTVPAMLTPGEFVFTKEATARAGVKNLNTFNDGGQITSFGSGGKAGPVLLSTLLSRRDNGNRIKRFKRMSKRHIENNDEISANIIRKNLEDYGFEDQDYPIITQEIEKRGVKFPIGTKSGSSRGKFDAISGSVVEDMLISKMGKRAKKYEGVDYHSDISKAPIDIIKGSSIYEVKFKDKPTSDNEILAKLLAYKLENNNYKSVGFQENKPQASSIDKIGLGTINLVHGAGIGDVAGYKSDYISWLRTEGKYKLSHGGMIHKFGSGGQTFGTGETKFPKRISNAYAKKIAQEQKDQEINIAWNNNPTNERIEIDPDTVAQQMSLPFDRAQFAATFNKRITRDSLVSNLSNFAKLIGLPQESLSTALPLQIDFGTTAGSAFSVIDGGRFARDAVGSRRYEGWDLSSYGFTDQDQQDIFGYKKLIEEKEKEIKKIKKTPKEIFDDGSFSIDNDALKRAWAEKDDLQIKVSNIEKKRRDAQKAAEKDKQSIVDSTGRGTVSVGTAFGPQPNKILYHELTHQLFNGLRAKSSDSFEKYKERVTQLFESDNNKLADAFDALSPDFGYRSADVVYGRKYKLSLLENAFMNKVRSGQSGEDVKPLNQLMRDGEKAYRATDFKPINSPINDILLRNDFTKDHIDRTEDNGKEEFLTTLVQNVPNLNDHLQQVLDDTLTELLSSAGIKKQRYAGGGQISRKVDFENGVGASPFDKTKISKLGSQIYNLEKSSGLSSYEFNDAVRFAKTNDFSEDEFKAYLTKRVQDKKSKADLVYNPETLRQFMLHGTQTPASTPEQMSLANMLKSDKPDSQYDPKYDRKALGGAVQRFAEGGQSDDIRTIKTRKQLQQYLYGKKSESPDTLVGSNVRIAGRLRRQAMKKGLSINRRTGLSAGDNSISGFDPTGDEGEYIGLDPSGSGKVIDDYLYYNAGGTVQKFVDGGWVKRMKQQPVKDLKDQLKVLYSSLELFGFQRKALVGTFSKSAPFMEDVGKREALERINAIREFLAAKEPQKKKVAEKEITLPKAPSGISDYLRSLIEENKTYDITGNYDGIVKQALNAAYKGNLGPGNKQQNIDKVGPKSIVRFAPGDGEYVDVSLGALENDIKYIDKVKKLKGEDIERLAPNKGYSISDMLDTVRAYQAIGLDGAINSVLGRRGDLSQSLADTSGLNKTERKRLGPAVDQPLSHFAGSLDAAMQFSLPEKLYGGIGASKQKLFIESAGVKVNKLEDTKKLVGKTVSIPSFLSTSEVPATAEKFARTGMMTIETNKKAKGLNPERAKLDTINRDKSKIRKMNQRLIADSLGKGRADENYADDYDIESEYILPRNSQFKVKSIEARDNRNKDSDLLLDHVDMDWYVKMLNRGGKIGTFADGGLVSRFMDGGVAQRKVGYIDYDIIADAANLATIEPGMKELDVTGPRLYADKLTELAVKARKEKSLNKLRAIYGVAGIGKTTLAQGQGTDQGTLRQTERFPILTPQDIQKATEVIVLSSSVSPDKLDSIFTNTDRTYTLSTSSKAEQQKAYDQRVERDITGKNLQDRAPGSTLNVGLDSALGEAQLGDRLGDKSVVLTRTSSGRLRRKTGDELVEVQKKRIGVTWGGFAPMTLGHESIMDSAAAMGIPPEDFLYLVGSNEGIDLSKADSYRTAILDQDARLLLAQAGAGSKGATVLRKAADFEVPTAFDISDPTADRRQVLLPAAGSRAFVADKTEVQMDKYRKAGYRVESLERKDGISGTMVRKLISEGNLGELQKVLSPQVYSLISDNIGIIQNRAKILPDLIEQVKSTQGVKLKDIDDQIKAIGLTRIEKKKMGDPEYAAKAEELLRLRGIRDKIKSAGSFEPYRLLRQLEQEFPDKYRLNLTPQSTPDIKPIRTVTKKPQTANLGGIIQSFMAGTPGGISEAPKPADRIARLARKQQRSILDTIVMEWQAIGGSGIKTALGIPNAVKLPRVPDIKSGGEAADEAKDLLNRVLAQRQVESIAKTKKIAKMRKVAIAGLFPIDYSNDFDNWQLDDGREIFAYVRGFSSLFAEEIRRLQEDTKAARQRFSEGIENRAALGLLGSRNIQGPVQPVAIDLDDTILLGTSMLGSDGREDLSAYRDPTKVEPNLAQATLTPLGMELARIEKENPGSLSRFTRILTARPQSTAGLISARLQELGLPYSDQPDVSGGITGVGGEGVNIATAKTANLSKIEKLIDNNRDTTRTVEKAGKKAHTYGVASTLSAEAEEKFGQGNIEGAMLEAALSERLGYQLNIDELARNRALDFPQGLGRAAQFFGLPPNIETEIKRTLDGSSFAKAREEFSRYFKENPDKFAVGGKLPKFARGRTIKAMVSNGEGFVPPETAKRIGYAKLDRMNWADRNFAGGSPGGISVFKGPGHGTSDSIGPIDLPVGGYVIREKAMQAMGFNSGGTVGVQRFLFGGRSKGPAPRPDTIRIDTIGASSEATQALTQLADVLVQLGVSVSQSSRLIKRGYQATAAEAQRAAQADLAMARASGASADVLFDLERAVERANRANQAELGLRQQLANVTGRQIQNFNEAIEAEMRALEARDRSSIIAAHTGPDPLSEENITAQLRALSVQRTNEAYENVAGRTGGGGLGAVDLGAVNASGADLARVLQTLSRDARTLEQMDRQYIENRRRTIAAELRAEGHIRQAASVRAGLDRQVEEQLRREVIARRQAIEDVAATMGERGPDNTQRDRQMGMALSFGLVTLGNLVSSAIDPKTSATNAGLSAGIQSASTSLGTGYGVMNEMQRVADNLEREGKVFGAKIMRMGSNIAMGATAAATLVNTINSVHNAMEEFYIELAKNRLDASLAGFDDAMSHIQRDINNLSFDDVNQKIRNASNNYAEVLEQISNRTVFTWTNFLDRIKQWAGFIDQQTVTQRSKIQELGDEGAYGRSKQGPEALRLEFDAIIPQLAQQEAALGKAASDAILTALRTRMQRGESSGSIIDSGDFDSFANTIANADASIREKILQIENSGQDDATIAQLKSEIITQYAKERIELEALVVSREKDANSMSRMTSVYTRSLSRMFDNMNQAINATNFALQSLTDKADLTAKALSGQAQAGEVNLSMLDILKNPRGYSSMEQNSARNAAAGFFGTRADTMPGLLGGAEAAQATIMSTINSTLENNMNANNETIARAIDANLRTVFSNLSLPPELADKLAKEVGWTIADLRKNNDDVIDFSALTEKVTSLGRVMETFEGAQNSAIQAIQSYQNVLNAYTKQTNDLIELSISQKQKERQASDILVSAYTNLQRALGNTIELDDSRNRLAGRVQTFTGQQETDAGAIFARLMQLNRDRQINESARATASGRNLAGINDFTKFNKDLEQSSIALRENYQALKLLAENTDYAADAMTRIQEAQQRVGGRVSFIEKLVTSTPEEVDALGSAIYRLQRNINGQLNTIGNSVGAQKAYNEAIRSGATAAEAMKAAQIAFANERRDTLSALNDILPFLGTGREAGNIRANALESMLRESGMGINPMFAQVLSALRNPETDPDTAAAIEHYNEANNLQADANRYLARIDAELAKDKSKMQADALIQGLKEVTLKFENQELKDLVDGINTLVPIVPAQNKALGGMIYAAAGQMVNFEPRGTDTVPAMLTPGEFVVNRAATQRHLPLLQSINSGKYSRGGSVRYYADGGYVHDAITDPSAIIDADQRSINKILDFTQPDVVTAFEQGIRTMYAIPTHFTFVHSDQQSPVRDDPTGLLDMRNLKPSNGQVVLGVGPIFETNSLENGTASVSIVDNGKNKSLFSDSANKIVNRNTNIIPPNIVDNPDFLTHINKTDYDQWKRSARTLLNKPRTIPAIPGNLHTDEPTLNDFNLFNETEANTNFYDPTKIWGLTHEKNTTLSLNPNGYKVWRNKGEADRVDAISQNLPQFDRGTPFVSKIWQQVKSSNSTWTKTESPEDIIGDKYASMVENLAQNEQAYSDTKDFFIDPTYNKGDLPPDVQALSDKLATVYNETEAFIPFGNNDNIDLNKYFDHLKTLATGKSLKTLMIFKPNDNALKEAVKLYENRPDLSKDIFVGWQNAPAKPYTTNTEIGIKGWGNMQHQAQKFFPWILNGKIEDLPEETQEEMKNNVQDTNPGNIKVATKISRAKMRLPLIGNLLPQLANEKIDVAYAYDEWTGKLYDPSTQTFAPNLSGPFYLPQRNDGSIFDKNNLFDINIYRFMGKDQLEMAKIKLPGPNTPEAKNLLDYYSAILNQDNIEKDTLKKNLRKAITYSWDKRRFVGTSFGNIPALNNTEEDATQNPVDITPYFLDQAEKALSALGNKAGKADTGFGQLRDAQISDADLPGVVRNLASGALQIFGRRQIPGFASNWLASYIGQVPRMQNMNGNFAKQLSASIAGVFNVAGGKVDTLLNQQNWNPRVFDYLKETWSLLAGAQQAFASLGSGNTRFIAQIRDLGQASGIMDLFRSMGGGVALGGLMGLSLNQNWENLVENAMTDGKIQNIGAGGSLDLAKEAPKNVKGLIDLIFNPYNEFANVSTRENLIDNFINELFNYRGQNPMMGGRAQANPVIDRQTMAWIKERTDILKTWYAGDRNAWVGQDYLYDKNLEPDNAQRTIDFNRSFLAAGQNYYADANRAHIELGLGDKYGPIPGQQWFTARAAKGFQTGGIVYAESGGHMVNFEPRGTDTVPAMLTPGEFVINRQATQKHLPLLTAINDGIQPYQTGGIVYAQKGGYKLRKELPSVQPRPVVTDTPRTPTTEGGANDLEIQAYPDKDKANRRGGSGRERSYDGGDGASNLGIEPGLEVGASKRSSPSRSYGNNAQSLEIETIPSSPKTPDSSKSRNYHDEDRPNSRNGIIKRAYRSLGGVVYARFGGMIDETTTGGPSNLREAYVSDERQTERTRALTQSITPVAYGVKLRDDFVIDNQMKKILGLPYTEGSGSNKRYYMHDRGAEISASEWNLSYNTPGGKYYNIDKDQAFQRRVANKWAKANADKLSKTDKFANAFVTEFNNSSNNNPSSFANLLDGLQTGLTGLGFIPGFGIAADLANAGIYLLRGDLTNAGISALASVPGYGDVFQATLLATGVAQAAEQYYDQQTAMNGSMLASGMVWASLYKKDLAGNEDFEALFKGQDEDDVKNAIKNYAQNHNIDLKRQGTVKDITANIDQLKTDPTWGKLWQTRINKAISGAKLTSAPSGASSKSSSSDTNTGPSKGRLGKWSKIGGLASAVLLGTGLIGAYMLTEDKKDKKLYEKDIVPQRGPLDKGQRLPARDELQVPDINQLNTDMREREAQATARAENTIGPQARTNAKLYQLPDLSGNQVPDIVDFVYSQLALNDKLRLLGRLKKTSGAQPTSKSTIDFLKNNINKDISVLQLAEWYKNIVMMNDVDGWKKAKKLLIDSPDADKFYRAKGGLIYASNGTLVPYEPRGTDTVPAMLTPGEFVVNRAATQKNLPLLKAINNGATGYNRGGMVYLRKGGQVGVGEYDYVKAWHEGHVPSKLELSRDPDMRRDWTAFQIVQDTQRIRQLPPLTLKELKYGIEEFKDEVEDDTRVSDVGLSYDLTTDDGLPDVDKIWWKWHRYADSQYDRWVDKFRNRPSYAMDKKNQRLMEENMPVLDAFKQAFVTAVAASFASKKPLSSGPGPDNKWDTPDDPTIDIDRSNFRDSLMFELTPIKDFLRKNDIDPDTTEYQDAESYDNVPLSRAVEVARGTPFDENFGAGWTPDQNQFRKQYTQWLSAQNARKTQRLVQQQKPQAIVSPAPPKSNMRLFSRIAPRRWESRDTETGKEGKYTTTGTLQQPWTQNQPSIKILKTNGKTTTVNLKQLSAADQRYLSELQPLRTWKDSTGKFSKEGRIIGIDNKDIMLQYPDNLTKTVPINKLSQADKTYLQEKYPEAFRQTKTDVASSSKEVASAGVRAAQQLEQRRQQSEKELNAIKTQTMSKWQAIWDNNKRAKHEAMIRDKVMKSRMFGSKPEEIESLKEEARNLGLSIDGIRTKEQVMEERQRLEKSATQSKIAARQKQEEAKQKQLDIIRGVQKEVDIKFGTGILGPYQQLDEGTLAKMWLFDWISGINAVYSGRTEGRPEILPRVELDELSGGVPNKKYYERWKKQTSDYWHSGYFGWIYDNTLADLVKEKASRTQSRLTTQALIQGHPLPRPMEESQSVDTTRFQKGGVVYASNGGMMVNYEPKGTDTVPAMLTPGEFVINRGATQKHLPLLQAINSNQYSKGGVVYANRGGLIYLQNGGQADTFNPLYPGLDREQLVKVLEALKEHRTKNKSNPVPYTTRHSMWGYSIVENPDGTTVLETPNEQQLQELKKLWYTKQGEISAYGPPPKDKGLLGASFAERFLAASDVLTNIGEARLATTAKGTKKFGMKPAAPAPKPPAPRPRIIMSPPPPPPPAPPVKTPEFGPPKPTPTDEWFNGMMKTIRQLPPAAQGTTRLFRIGDVPRDYVKPLTGQIYGKTVPIEEYEKWIDRAKATAVGMDTEPRKAKGKWFTDAANELDFYIRKNSDSLGSLRAYYMDVSNGELSQYNVKNSEFHQNSLNHDREFVLPHADKATRLYGPVGPSGYATGGIVYAANGGMMVNYEPKGTDTVPAMLTPGEFVVNRAATQKHLPLLKAINEGATGYSNGGVVYLSGGGLTSDQEERFTALNRMPNRNNTEEAEYQDLKNRRSRSGTRSSTNEMTNNDSRSRKKKIRERNERMALMGISPKNRTLEQQNRYDRLTSEREKDRPDITARKERNQRMALMAIPPNKRTQEQQDRYNKLVAKRDQDRPDIAQRNANRKAAQSYEVEATKRSNERLVDKYLEEYRASGSEMSPEQWAAENKPGMRGQRLDAFLARASGAEGYDYGYKMNDEQFADAMSANRARIDAMTDKKAAKYTSAGGIVYAANGGMMVNYEPKGTDTVPAMLTPGEFVVNRAATQKHLPLLQAINSRNYSSGGVVYMARAGMVTMSPEQLGQAAQDPRNRRKKPLDRQEQAEEAKKRREQKAEAADRRKRFISLSPLMQMMVKEIESSPFFYDDFNNSAINEALTDAEVTANATKKINDAIGDDQKRKMFMSLGKDAFYRFSQLMRWYTNATNALQKKGTKETDFVNNATGLPTTIGDFLNKYPAQAGLTLRSILSNQQTMSIREAAAIRNGWIALAQQYSVLFNSMTPEAIINQIMSSAAGPPKAFSRGGVVYANNGMLVPYQPKGTDTVPAMLTPGEFVVNRESTRQNLSLLRAINSGSYANGGVVKYLSEGTAGGLSFNNILSSFTSGIKQATTAINTLLTTLQNTAGGVNNDGGTTNVGGLDGLGQFTAKFDQFINQLSQLNLPPEININGNHKVEVVVNGAQALQELLEGPLADLMKQQVQLAFNKLRTDSEGQIG